MAVMTAALIRLYPLAWRQRYGAEMRELLGREPVSLRVMADLLAGAIDARLSPQNIVLPHTALGNPTQRGVKTMTRIFRCAPEGVSVADQVRSASWMIGGAAGLMILATGLKLKIGPNSLSEGLLYSGFPAALMLSSQCTYLRPYSPAARRFIAIGGASAIVLFMWGVTALNSRI